METVIELRNVIARNPSLRLKTPVTLTVNKGEQIAIMGPNGSGKTLLTNIISGNCAIDPSCEEGGDIQIKTLIRTIAFRDSYGNADATWCYMQRWNMTEIDDSPEVRTIFPNVTDRDWFDRLFSLFQLERIWDKKLVSLSSGEMRKYQLAKALASRPGMLIIDSPYIGLDKESRESLVRLFAELAESGLHIVTVVSRDIDIAPFVTHVIRMDNLEYVGKYTVQEYFNGNADNTDPSAGVLSEEKVSLMKSLPAIQSDSDEIVNCKGITLNYGTRSLFNGLQWVVRRGEHWALLGQNGAGKSALLSLVYADNPQAYACNIALFGKDRGSGESIWDIKKNIGYVSPEMHRSYVRHYPAIDIVASGLHDTIGLYRKINDQERAICSNWMHIFGITELAQSDFANLSSGQQRLILLARAFVKNPSLIILDEPLHGLDTANRQLAINIIRAFCSQPEKTMIMVTHYPEELPECIDHIQTLTRSE